ncbi:MAG: type I-C CRISPR-associated protein Cas8c/Csd1 [Polyangiales bacterium]
MMLQALHALALRQNLREDPDFDQRRLHFVLVIDAAGTFRSLIPMLDERGRPTMRRGPKEPIRTRAVVPGYFFDKPSYVLGLASSDEKDPVRAAAKARSNVDAFIEEVSRAADATGDAGALAVKRFLARLDEQRQRVLDAAPLKTAAKGKTTSPWAWDGTEYLTFSLDTDDGLPVYDRPALADRWRALRGGSSPADELAQEADPKRAPDVEGRCLVTGEWTRLARLHAPLQRVPEAQARSRLVSFNATAFESYGLSEAQMAPVSRDGSESYAAALNWLLAEVPGRRFRAGVSLADDTVAVFWTGAESTVAEDLSAWFAPNEDDALRLAESPWRGSPPSEAEVPFYALTLAGNSARVVVRDWYQTTAARIRENVRAWFDDLALVGAGERPLAIRALLGALEATPDAASNKNGASAALASRMFRAAVMGAAFPRELLGMALRRMRVAPKRDDKLDRYRVHARAALIKTALLRLNRERHERDLEVTVALNDDDNRNAYLLGRLFATLEKLQQMAVNPNATLRDRFYGAASSTPAVVFPRLLRLSMHHAARLDGGWPESIKARLMARIDAFPRVLGLEEQGLFAIGYYHQQQDFFTKRVKEPVASNAPGGAEETTT